MFCEKDDEMRTLAMPDPLAIVDPATYHNVCITELGAQAPNGVRAECKYVFVWEAVEKAMQGHDNTIVAIKDQLWECFKKTVEVSRKKS